jgi:hypothetical protein
MDRRYKKKIDKYWAKMEKSATSEINDLDPTSWFDYWHCHIDWYGKGGRRLDNRPASLELGYKILKYVELFRLKCTLPTQSWWFIHEQSYEDAVYIHSENENKSPYPFQFDEVEWNNTTNSILNNIIDLTKHKIGRINNEHGITYVVTENA